MFMEWLEERDKRKQRASFFKENKGARQSYSIAVVGMGNLGEGTAKLLSSIQDQVIPKIDGLGLISRTPERLEPLKNELSVASGNELNFIRTINTANLEDFVNEFDICILTLDAEKAAPIETLDAGRIARVDRFKSLTKNNIDLMKKTASAFKKDYQGSIVVVTNLPEIMGYIFSQYSQVDPRQIIPMVHTDTLRTIKVLKRHADLTQRLDVSVDNAYAIGHHQSPWPFISDADVLPPPSKGIKLFRSLNVKDEKKISNYITNPRGFFEQEIVKPFIEQKDFIKLSPEEQGVRLKQITLDETVEAILETVKAIMNQKKGAISGGVFLPEEGLYAELPVDVEGPYFLPKKGFLKELPDLDKDEFYKRINGCNKNPQNKIIGLKPTIERLKQEGAIQSSSPTIIHDPLRIEDPSRKQKQTFIIGAAGGAQTVYLWNRLGKNIREIPVTIRGEPRFAASVKHFNYEGEDYVLIGTSTGIQLNSLQDPKFRREMLIINPENGKDEKKESPGKIGHIRDMVVIDGSLIASDYHLSVGTNTGKGLFRASIEEVLANEKRPVELGNIFSEKEGAGPMAVVDYKGEKAIIFPSGNTLRRFTLKYGEIKPIFSYDHPITALTKDAVAFGDAAGNIVLLDKEQNIMSKHLVNLNGTPITSLEHVSEQGEHLLVGTKRSLFKHYIMKDGALEKRYFRMVGRRSPYLVESGDRETYPVENVSYTFMNNTGRVYMTCEHDIISIRFSNLLQDNPEKIRNNFDSYSAIFDKAPRTIYGLEICMGDNK